VVLWAAVIFVGSGDVLSEGRTSRFLGPLLRWFDPDMSEASLQQLQAIIRKGGHLTEYAILVLLCLRALTRSSPMLPSAWSWRAALLALGFCVVYAISDEVHQSFVSSRYGSGLDVVIDALGAGLGLGGAWLGVKWRRRAPNDSTMQDAPAVGAAR